MYVCPQMFNHAFVPNVNPSGVRKTCEVNLTKSGRRERGSASIFPLQYLRSSWKRKIVAGCGRRRPFLAAIDVPPPAPDAIVRCHGVVYTRSFLEESRPEQRFGGGVTPGSEKYITEFSCGSLSKQRGEYWCSHGRFIKGGCSAGELQKKYEACRLAQFLSTYFMIFVSKTRSDVQRRNLVHGVTTFVTATTANTFLQL